MASAKFFEELASGPRSSVGDIVFALPERLVNVGPRSDVQQSLVRFSVLHHRFSLTVNGQNYRALTLFQLFEKFARLPPEICQRLNVLRNIQHRSHLSTAPN
jgi:hypothetical protein